MDNVKSADAGLSLDNAPPGMAPIEEVNASEKAPDTSSGETPQSGSVEAEQTPTPEEGKSEKAEEAKFEMPEKFQGKSAEEIAQSYTELESQNKKVEMERSELEKLFVKTDETSESTGTPEKQVVDDVKNVIDQARPAIQEEFNKLLSPTIAKLELTDMLSRYGNSFKQVAPQVANKVKDNPSLSMEDAYKLVSFDHLKRTSYNQGVSKASETEEARKKAQVETAKPSGYRPTTLQEAVKDPNTNVSEIADAMGPEWNRFKEISEKKSRQRR